MPFSMEIIGKAEKCGVTDKYILSVKASVLEAKGDEDEASDLRMEQINKNSGNPAFYNDEANFLIKKGKYGEARAIIETVEKLGCANEVTDRIKAKLPGI
jgi:hypothetical protein